MVENLEDFLGSGLVDLPVGEVSKSDVKNGSILGGVDVLAGEHVVSVLLDAWEETRQGRRARRKWRRRRPMRSAFLRKRRCGEEAKGGVRGSTRESRDGPETS